MSFVYTFVPFVVKKNFCLTTKSTKESTKSTKVFTKDFNEVQSLYFMDYIINKPGNAGK